MLAGALSSKQNVNAMGKTPSPRSSTARLALRLAISLAVSAAFIWLSLRHTDVRSVARAIASANPVPLLGYLGILLVVHGVRTVRWHLLLQSVGPVGLRRVNEASAIGFMMLVLLPLRLGELARPLLVARAVPGAGPPLRRSGAMASCVVERVIDGLGLGLLGIVALRLVGAGEGDRAADFARHAAWVVTAAFSGLCVALVAAFFMRERATALVRWVLGRVAPRLANRVGGMLDAFIGALHLGSPWRVAAVLALTVAHWSLHVLGFFWLAPAFGFQLTIVMACAVLAVQAVGVMVPAGPGMIGTSQFFTQLGVSIFVPGALTVPALAARSAGYANTIWMLQFGQQVALGLLFWVGSRIALGDVLGRDPVPEVEVEAVEVTSAAVR